MTQSEMEAMLGRPLTTKEKANFSSYLEIATDLVSDVLCYPLCSEAKVKSFNPRDGYSTIYTGAFTYVSSVEVNGTAVTNYTPALWDDVNAKWFNSLIFTHKLKKGDKVTVTAQWGFNKLPADLKQLISKYFAFASSGSKNESSIQSKKVEDFSITYANADKTKLQQIEDANSLTISKYSICNVGNLQHGSICLSHGARNCGYCI